MAHVEKLLLRAVDTVTGEVIKQKWVYDSHVADCFACDWYLKYKQKPTMPDIYIGKQIRFHGWPRSEAYHARNALRQQQSATSTQTQKPLTTGS